MATDLFTPTVQHALDVAGIFAFALRLLALRFHWRAPRAWHRRSAAAAGEGE